jgi:MFS family permease
LRRNEDNKMAILRLRSATLAGDGAVRPATLVAPLRVPDFRLAWGGLLCGFLGDQAQTVILAIVALDLVGKASGWGGLLAVQAVPRLLILLVGGLIADRVRAPVILRTVSALNAGALLALAALHATGALTLTHLYAFALIYGALAAFTQPASESLVPALLPDHLIRRGNALRSSAVNCARLFAPPAATTLFAVAGVVPALALTALTFLAGAFLYGLMPARPAKAQTGGMAVEQLHAGLAIAWQVPAIGVPILMVAVFNLGYAGATLVGVPTLARLVLATDNQGIGLLLGAIGAGALVGALSTGVRTKVTHLGRFACGAIGGVGVGLVGAGLAPSAGVAAICLAVSGLGISSAAVALLTIVQTHTPPEVRGRVMAVFSLALTSLTPISYAAAGALGDAVGPRGVLIAGGVCVLAASVIGLTCRAMRDDSGKD